MKKISPKTIFLTIVAIVVVLAVVGYFVLPSYLYNKTMDGLRRDAGLAKKSQDIPDFNIVYLEGGTGDAMILLHGFGANKDNWLRFAKHFTSGYRVIIPDIPGFGESARPENAKYTIAAQVERLNLLVKALNLDTFHLVGNSMGGAIAGTYAATYPAKVKTLALFDSGGIHAPEKSERERLLESGVNVFVVQNVEDYDRLLALNFHQPIKIPSPVKKYLAKEAAQTAPFITKIYDEITHTDFYALEEKLSAITAPTLIVWGDSDKVLDISSVPVFEKKIKKARSSVIKECGHLPMLEKPEATATVYKDFLKDQN